MSEMSEMLELKVGEIYYILKPAPGAIPNQVEITKITPRTVVYNDKFIFQCPGENVLFKNTDLDDTQEFFIQDYYIAWVKAFENNDYYGSNKTYIDEYKHILEDIYEHRPELIY